MRNAHTIDISAFVAHAIVVPGMTTAWMFPGDDAPAMVNVYRIAREGLNRNLYACSACGNQLVGLNDQPCIHIVAERMRLDDHRTFEIRFSNRPSEEHKDANDGA